MKDALISLAEESLHNLLVWTLIYLYIVNELFIHLLSIYYGPGTILGIEMENL